MPNTETSGVLAAERGLGRKTQKQRPGARRAHVPSQSTHWGCSSRRRYDTLLEVHGQEEMDRLGYLRVSPAFRVIALGLPVPPYAGTPLDPPLRSRFQCMAVDLQDSGELLGQLIATAPAAKRHRLEALVGFFEGLMGVGPRPLRASLRAWPCVLQPRRSRADAICTTVLCPLGHAPLPLCPRTQTRIRTKKMSGGGTTPPLGPTLPPTHPPPLPSHVKKHFFFGADVLCVPQGHVRGVSEQCTLNSTCL